PRGPVRDAQGRLAHAVRGDQLLDHRVHHRGDPHRLHRRARLRVRRRDPAPVRTKSPDTHTEAPITDLPPDHDDDATAGDEPAAAETSGEVVEGHTEVAEAGADAGAADGAAGETAETAEGDA